MTKLFQTACVLALALSAPQLARALPVSKNREHVAPVKSAPPKNASAKKVASNKPQLATKGKGKAKPCYAKPVPLMRVRGDQLEPDQVSLTMCNGEPNPAALEQISLLGRPRDVERPETSELRAYRARPAGTKSKTQRVQDLMFVCERVMRLHPGLLPRLQKIANHYPGRVIEIISGYRPDARETSRHHHGRALDLRVAGVRRERLRDFLRTFDNTGVGYYPNSFFVHMDVRDAKGYWVDRSGPGEPADYGPWPLQKGKRGWTAPLTARAQPKRDNVLRGALADLDALRGPLAAHGAANLTGGKRAQPSARETLSASAARFAQANAPRAEPNLRREPAHDGDEMTQSEVTRAREEARKALEGL